VDIEVDEEEEQEPVYIRHRAARPRRSELIDDAMIKPPNSFLALHLVIPVHRIVQNERKTLGAQKRKSAVHCRVRHPKITKSGLCDKKPRECCKRHHHLK